MLKKRLSQNLIKDKNMLAKLVRLAGIEKGDAIVEIGAGQGDLTRYLCEKASSVCAIEIDEDFREHLAALQGLYGNLRVIMGDALGKPFPLPEDGSAIKVVGNIPYKITGPVLFKLLAERGSIETAHITVQKEVAQRVVSAPRRKTYGAVSAIFQLCAEVRLLLNLKAQIFIPPPKVDSSFLAITFRKERLTLDPDVLAFIKTCFENKRKQMRYTLVRHYGDETVAWLYEVMGFSPAVRAEEIPPEAFLETYSHLKNASIGNNSVTRPGDKKRGRGKEGAGRGRRGVP
jgi:16S rRNA (adenine1518-N6/adenine1519-N6)-dimethyltransferase